MALPRRRRMLFAVECTLMARAGRNFRARGAAPGTLAHLAPEMRLAERVGTGLQAVHSE